MIADTERAWAAGFFDGEGCVPNGLGRSGRPRSPCITITQANTVSEPPDTLLRFQAAIGGHGRISGPVLQERRKPRYVLNVTRYEHVVAARDALWPWLSAAKRADFTARFEAHREVRENRRPRSLPWTHCAAGHELNEDNVYRSGTSRRCKICQKADTRRRRLT